MRQKRPLKILFSLFIALSALFAPLAARAMDTSAKQAILIDFDTGAVLYEKDSDVPMPPSSMSKLMTVYMLFERLKDGSISLNDEFLVSKKAWQMAGSKMFVEVGKRARVDDLLRGIVIQSGNDACIVVAENLSTSEEAFAQEMNAKARKLGLTDSNFVNSTGWPDDGHMMTARDLAVLAKRLIENFPDYYPLFKEKSFTYAGITQENRNRLLWNPATGVDGLKTGHTDAGGYGLVASAEQNDRRLILVVNGLDSMNAREAEPERLLQWGFRSFDNVHFFAPNDAVDTVPVWLGVEPAVPLVVKEDVTLTLSRRAMQDMTVKVVYDGPIPAPVKSGEKVAILRIEGPGMDPIEYPLVAGADVPRLGFVGRLGAAFRHIIWGAAG